VSEKKKIPHTILHDGTLLFKFDGNPPTNIPGYTAREGDPYTWVPDFAEDCKHRSVEKIQRPCKEWKCVFMCALFKKAVNQIFCNDCMEEKE